MITGLLIATMFWSKILRILYVVMVIELTMPLTTEPHGRRDAMDFENQIHCLETEAYSSILKAFIAQSDLFTWVSTYSEPVIFDQVCLFIEYLNSANYFFLYAVSAENLFVPAGQRGAYD